VTGPDRHGRVVEQDTSEAGIVGGMAAPERLTAEQVSASEDLDDWRVLLQSLHASFKTGSMAAGVELAARIGAAADEANHHPDLTITYPRVHVSLTTHEADGLTARDVDLARRISGIAAELGAEADPQAVTSLEIAIDALDIAAVRPFWEAVLGYRLDGDDAVADRYGRNPLFWFQQMDEPRPQRNRIHVDVTVPHDVAQERIDAALAAAGSLVSDPRAPAFWILADPEGNEACICTWQARE
jgi:4a-hydroxytetrahydrobiopterin dehydratase